MSLPPPLAVDLLLEAGDWPDLSGLPVVEAAQRAFAQAGEEGPADLSLVLADNALVRSLNAQYRGKDAPTNVLSFASRDAEAPPLPEGEIEPLGDVILALETIEAEATEQGKTFSAHLLHLVVHGVLHLVGFDHQDEAEAAEMEHLETVILADLGIADPYHGLEPGECLHQP